MKVHYRAHNFSQIAPILRQNYPVTIITLYFLLTYLLYGAESLRS